MRGVTGKPRASSLASIIAGSDGLSLATPLDFNELGAKCSELLAAYNSTEYKKRFDFIDFLRAERDPKTVAKLNDKLVKQLKSGDLTGIHSCPPEPIDWETIDGFTFGLAKTAEIYDDIDLEEWLKDRDTAVPLTTDALKRARVGVRISGSDAPQLKWSLYFCVVFEYQFGSKLYVLTGGDWFEIASKFVSRVDKRILGLVSTSPALPKAKKSEKEKYNDRAAKEKGYVLMDRKFARVDGSSIEFSDLLTDKREIVHVKPYKGSATLSHLFCQAIVSADAFIADEEFRKQVGAHVEKHNKKLSTLIKKGRPQNDHYKIVYAIIRKM